MTAQLHLPSGEERERFGVLSGALNSIGLPGGTYLIAPVRNPPAMVEIVTSHTLVPGKGPRLTKIRKDVFKLSPAEHELVSDRQRVEAALERMTEIAVDAAGRPITPDLSIPDQWGKTRCHIFFDPPSTERPLYEPSITEELVPRLRDAPTSMSHRRAFIARKFAGVESMARRILTGVPRTSAAKRAFGGLPTPRQVAVDGLLQAGLRHEERAARPVRTATFSRFIRDWRTWVAGTLLLCCAPFVAAASALLSLAVPFALAGLAVAGVMGVYGGSRLLSGMLAIGQDQQNFARRSVTARRHGVMAAGFSLLADVASKIGINSEKVQAKAEHARRQPVTELYRRVDEIQARLAAEEGPFAPQCVVELQPGNVVEGLSAVRKAILSDAVRENGPWFDEVLTGATVDTSFGFTWKVNGSQSSEARTLAARVLFAPGGAEKVLRNLAETGKLTLSKTASGAEVLQLTDAGRQCVDRTIPTLGQDASRVVAR